ncbi:MAG: tetratricopeptide repeat protein [Bacteroidetes bacterium]|nr:tetratricopeptide repeat protein [Bacteroidota bacterium]
MNSLKSYLFAVFLLVLPFSGFPQATKKHLKEAEKLEKEGKYEDASKVYTNVVGLDSLSYKAYAGRARCYVKLYKPAEALADYKKAVQIINPDDKMKRLYARYVERDMSAEKLIFYQAGKFFMEQNMLHEADVALRKALEIDRVYADAIDTEVQVLVKLREFEQALSITQLGIDSKINAPNYYRHAAIHDSLNHTEQAEKYYRYALEHDSKYFPAHVALAVINVKLGKYDAAFNHCQIVLKKEPENTDALFARSLVNAATKNLPNAIDDITKVVVAKPSEQAYTKRAEYYETMKQYHNAAADYSSIIKEQPRNYGFYYKRALCYEQMQEKKLATDDYKMVVSLIKDREDLNDMRKAITERQFQLNREYVKPKIMLSGLKDKNTLNAPANLSTLNLSGKITDENIITSVTVNSQVAVFSKDSLNPEFSITLKNAAELNEFSVSATDVYDNTETMLYQITRTESDKPVIIIETPYTSPENEISIENNGAELYIQGKIQDSSLIASITIDGINASFNAKYLNPGFSAQIRIADKQEIKMTAKDIYGNETEQIFKIDRSALLASIDNPMGNTWVVFIENSNYAHYSSLEGPAKDFMALRSALANYKITRFVHKQNMTKTQLEKFFSLELRDDIKNAKVTSLLIWYAGHGKYVKPKSGYWIPTDAKIDDEFSYYSINALKAAMQSYPERLLHTLVVTDACESGPTFVVNAKEDGSDDKDCKNADLTKSKSSQVFTSAGFELASDNSLFTKTFVASLNNNADACIAIDKIVKKVAYSVSQQGNQAPKFGKIKDLEDAGGTFFFMKK